MNRNTGRTATGGALCAGEGCRLRDGSGQPRHRVIAGRRLCGLCRDRLVAQLRSLPRLYDECGQLLGGSRQFNEKTSGGPLPGMPFNTAAADARAAILTVLSSWSGLIARERKLAPPARTVRSLVEFAVRHIDWLTAHFAAADLTREVAHLVRGAQQVVQPGAGRRVVVGACMEPECSGTLVAVVLPREHGEPNRIVCTADHGHAWPEHEWLRLRHRMERGQTRTAVPSVARTIRWLSAADISHLWHVAPGSVYRLASEHQWRRRNHSGRTYYHEADVHHALSRRVTSV